MAFGPYVSILYGFAFVFFLVFLDIDIEGFELFSAYICGCSKNNICDFRLTPRSR